MVVIVPDQAVTRPIMNLFCIIQPLYFGIPNSPVPVIVIRKFCSVIVSLPHDVVSLSIILLSYHKGSWDFTIKSTDNLWRVTQLVISTCKISLLCHGIHLHKLFIDPFAYNIVCNKNIFFINFNIITIANRRMSRNESYKISGTPHATTCMSFILVRILLRRN